MKPKTLAFVIHKAENILLIKEFRIQFIKDYHLINDDNWEACE